ncbi:MAG: hypothetical protein IPK82_08890 [Polyangiaceae bacterium]|nr:hypothetical protein [Polyangiaceae bacterium]
MTAEPCAAKNGKNPPVSEQTVEGFPSLKVETRAAALLFGVGVLALTGTLSFRTVIGLPDYPLGSVDWAVLGIQCTVELIIAVGLGFFVTRTLRVGAAKAVLIVLAVIISVFKFLLFMAFIAIAEPPDSLLSPGTLILCSLVTLPLYWTFFPVISAVQTARASRSIDSPLQVTRALCSWLAGVSFISLVLGPDNVVRLWAFIAFTAALLLIRRGNIAIAKLEQWATDAIARGAPLYSIREGAADPSVPTVFDDDSPKAVIVRHEQDKASYRREPTQVDIAAIDPVKLQTKRSFTGRMGGKLAVSLSISALISALCWPFLHADDIPPRTLATAYPHSKVERYNEDIQKKRAPEGITLWKISMGEQREMVGFDNIRHVLLSKSELIVRAKDLPIEQLAELTNDVLFNGICCVVTTPKDDKTQDGELAKAPTIENDRLTFFRTYRGQTHKFVINLTTGEQN